MGQHKNKFSCNRVSTELLLIGYAGKIRLITETCILVTVYLILLIPRRFADRVSQTSADSTAMRSVSQKFLHAWHIFRIFVLHFEKNVHTSRGTSYNIKRSDCWLGCHQDQHKLGPCLLWRLHAHAHAHAQCPFSQISARAWRMPLPLRHSASEQLKTIIAHARACAICV